MITNAILAQARVILTQVAGDGGLIVVVPQSMPVGTEENPGLCLGTDVQVKEIQDQMGQAETRKHIAPDVNWDALIARVRLDTIVVREAVFGGTKAYQSAVIWHENCHVMYGATENGDVYLQEVVLLTTYSNDLGVDAVRTVLEGRIPAYRAAVDPGKSGLASYLRNTWSITL
jgi:hypothetical protein